MHYTAVVSQGDEIMTSIISNSLEANAHVGRHLCLQSIRWLPGFPS